MSVVVSFGLLIHHFLIAPSAPAPIPRNADDELDPSPSDLPAPAPPPASASVSASASPGAPAPAPAASSATAAPHAPPAGTPEAEARAALEKLRDGVRTCVTTNIGVLPGTSFPVPARLGTLRGGFQAAPAVWRTPVFHCTKFKVTGPQRFQLQWQNDSATTTGRGVAWLDDDADGKPDKSLSFSAKLTKRNDVELGPVEVDSEPRDIQSR